MSCCIADPAAIVLKLTFWRGVGPAAGTIHPGRALVSGGGVGSTEEGLGNSGRRGGSLEEAEWPLKDEAYQDGRVARQGAGG